MDNKQKFFSPLVLARVGLATAFIAVCSWISIPIGSVPITLQTFAVMLTVGVFGLSQGLLAVALYICIGAIGIPVFASFNSGVAYIMGPTGGFIIGFIFTALIVGLFIKRYRDNKWALFFAMLLGIAACYFFGTIWFLAYFKLQGNEKSLLAALTACVFPFIIPDVIKAVLAVFLTFRLRPLLAKIRRK